MGKQSQLGFTLIELVVVIVILGVLTITAAPKFLDFKKDARVASLQGVIAALKSANSLIYAKAAIQGQESIGRANPRRRHLGSVAIDKSGTVVATNFGYLSNEGNNDNRALQNLAKILEVESIIRLRNNRTVADSGFGLDSVNRRQFYLYPAGFNRTQLCRIEYTSAQAVGEQPRYVLVTDDC
ncbi:prepilin-type N-terminal cleavage/methylation domain-containing protein [Paraferrimonas sedimenticola]|uniref:V10 pilin n=1 Tax=Paraferrimonas sedimenticola TaxID=375674 RepID=A0AA37RY42_9GAMM|nr:prepilin-type N-terminal cleavage/methylation domain-containing protein [Paraferrimonas sedimenticola]GLP97383.1 V10 pilin [Paraferrimonas sedimenticola]